MSERIFVSASKDIASGSLRGVEPEWNNVLWVWLVLIIVLFSSVISISVDVLAIVHFLERGVHVIALISLLEWGV